MHSICKLYHNDKISLAIYNIYIVYINNLHKASFIPDSLKMRYTTSIFYMPRTYHCTLFTCHGMTNIQLDF